MLAGCGRVRAAARGCRARRNPDAANIVPAGMPWQNFTVARCNRATFHNCGEIGQLTREAQKNPVIACGKLPKIALICLKKQSLGYLARTSAHACGDIGRVIVLA